MTMLEKAARALWDEMRNAGEPLYDDLGVITREVLDGMARAVLRAIREVDEATFHEGWMAMRAGEDAGPGEPWLAMIDAILEEKA